MEDPLSRGIRFGLAGGGAVVLVMALVYWRSRELFLSPIFQWSLLVLYLVAMLLAAAPRDRFTRKEALQAGAIAVLLTSAAFYLYTYMLYEVFDPSLYDLQSQLMIENAQQFAVSNPGEMSQSPQVIYAPENLKYTFSGILRNYAQGAIVGIAAAYLLAQAVGKKEV